MTGNADQIRYWNDVAGSRWVRGQDRLDRLMAPLGEALLAAAAPAPGERVLDVGCGCGDLALQLAAIVGRRGTVTAVDVSRPMLRHAAIREREDNREAVAPIRWLEADASAESFGDHHDLLVSRFGVMFFDDPPGAFANLRRALKGGGRFAFLAWRRRAEVEWMGAPLDWIAPALPVPAPSDGEPGPFGLADAEATCGTLRVAGFDAVEAAALDCEIVVGDDLAAAMRMLGETGPAAGAMREAGDVEREEAMRLLERHLAGRVASDGAVRLGAACWIYRGRAG